jgi:hypothetical protein
MMVPLVFETLARDLSKLANAATRLLEKLEAKL